MQLDLYFILFIRVGKINGALNREGHPKRKITSIELMPHAEYNSIMQSPLSLSIRPSHFFFFFRDHESPFHQLSTALVHFTNIHTAHRQNWLANK